MSRIARTAPAGLALALAVTLSACGSSGGDVAADEKQTLTVWAMGAEGEKLAEVAKVYQKANPNITVKVTPVGWDVAHQKLVSAAAAGTLPDVAQMGRGCRARGEIEDPLIALRSHRAGSRRTPERVVAERHDGVGAVVSGRDLVEHAADALGVLTEVGAIGLAHPSSLDLCRLSASRRSSHPSAVASSNGVSCARTRVSRSSVRSSRRVITSAGYA